TRQERESVTSLWSWNNPIVNAVCAIRRRATHTQPRHHVLEAVEHEEPDERGPVHAKSGRRQCPARSGADERNSRSRVIRSASATSSESITSHVDLATRDDVRSE